MINIHVLECAERTTKAMSMQTVSRPCEQCSTHTEEMSQNRILIP